MLAFTVFGVIIGIIGVIAFIVVSCFVIMGCVFWGDMRQNQQTAEKYAGKKLFNWYGGEIKQKK